MSKINFYNIYFGVLLIKMIQVIGSGHKRKVLAINFEREIIVQNCKKNKGELYLKVINVIIFFLFINNYFDFYDLKVLVWVVFNVIIYFFILFISINVIFVALITLIWKL